MMSFADSILTQDLGPLRSRLLHHPLWQQVEDGTLDRARLRLFALQDWWLVRQAYRLDGLTIAAMPDLDAQEHLIRKLTTKIGACELLIRFGEGVGLARSDFDDVEPLAGCMALTTYFYWMLAYGTVGEKLAAIGASEDIFVQICARVKPALLHHYRLSEEQVEFFTVHDAIGESVHRVDEAALRRYAIPEERARITRALRLSHEFELLFYDTILNAPISQPFGSNHRDR
jgi:pyrroloquinoline-quinone synthase